MVQHDNELRHFRVIVAHRHDPNVLHLLERGKGRRQFLAKLPGIGRVDMSVERVLPHQ